jgi:hypothetical protein
MSSYVSYFTSNIIKLDMKGYYAFNEKPPGRSKIRKRKYFGYSGRHQVHMNFPLSPSLPSLLQHLPRFLGHCSKNNV